MIDLKQLLKKAVVGTKQTSAILYWDKDVCGFVSQQNKVGTLPEYSKEQVNEMIASGKIIVGEDGLPKVVPRVQSSTEEDKETQYKRLVVKFIREKYSADDEIAILRQQEEKTLEYQEYYAYCEECKRRAREEVYSNEV